MRPIRVDFAQNRTYRPDHMLFGHFGSEVNAGEDGAEEDSG